MQKQDVILRIVQAGWRTTDLITRGKFLTKSYEQYEINVIKNAHGWELRKNHDETLGLAKTLKEARSKIADYITYDHATLHAS